MELSMRKTILKNHNEGSVLQQKKKQLPNTFVSHPRAQTLTKINFEPFFVIWSWLTRFCHRDINIEISNHRYWTLLQSVKKPTKPAWWSCARSSVFWSGLVRYDIRCDRLGSKAAACAAFLTRIWVEHFGSTSQCSLKTSGGRICNKVKKKCENAKENANCM